MIKQHNLTMHKIIPLYVILIPLATSSINILSNLVLLPHALVLDPKCKWVRILWKRAGGFMAGSIMV